MLIGSKHVRFGSGGGADRTLRDCGELTPGTSSEMECYGTVYGNQSMSFNTDLAVIAEEEEE